MKLGATIAVVNQKGGVGKTTNSVHLAAGFGERGYKVLLVDMDPSGGSGKRLGVPVDSVGGVLELLMGQGTLGELVVTEKMPKGVHLLAARSQLIKLAQYIAETEDLKFIDPLMVLRQVLAGAREAYDVVVIDTPPLAGNLPAMASMCAADWVVVSVDLMSDSVDGMAAALKDFAILKKTRLPGLALLGIAATKADRRCSAMISGLRKRLKELKGDRYLFDAMVRSGAQALELSFKKGISVLQLPGNKDLPVADDFRAMVREAEGRILNRAAFLAYAGYETESFEPASVIGVTEAVGGLLEVARA